MAQMKSDNAKKGMERAPHRSLFYAMGYTDEELRRPLVGVCCAKNEIIPGHFELDRIAEAAKIVPLVQLALSPQCGFASTEEGNIMTEAQQWAKVKLVEEIAAEVWGED